MIKKIDNKPVTNTEKDHLTIWLNELKSLNEIKKRVFDFEGLGALGKGGKAGFKTRASVDRVGSPVNQASKKEKESAIGIAPGAKAPATNPHENFVGLNISENNVRAIIKSF